MIIHSPPSGSSHINYRAAITNSYRYLPNVRDMWRWQSLSRFIGGKTGITDEGGSRTQLKYKKK